MGVSAWDFEPAASHTSVRPGPLGERVTSQIRIQRLPGLQGPVRIDHAGPLFNNWSREFQDGDGRARGPSEHRPEGLTAKVSCPGSRPGNLHAQQTPGGLLLAQGYAVRTLVWGFNGSPGEVVTAQ